MDLIWTDGKHVEQGILHKYTMDLAYGNDENDFELTLGIGAERIPTDGIVTIDGTEYGGVIDGRSVHTKENRVVYFGRTWHGILEGKVVNPPSGQDYYDAKGDAHAILRKLISEWGLQSLFEVAPGDSGIGVSYRFRRYDLGYTGIRRMLLNSNSKLVMERRNGKVVLSAEPVTDYSQYHELDSDVIHFEVRQVTRSVNHLVCLGKGELKDRIVIHLYADKHGNVSTVQTLFGVNEVTEIYDYNNAEYEELLESGIEKLRALIEPSSAKISEFNPNSPFGIDDLVGARESRTGIYVSSHVIKKIVTVTDGRVRVEHQVGTSVGSLNDKAETKPVEPGSMTYVGTIEPTDSIRVGDMWYNPETRTIEVFGESEIWASLDYTNDDKANEAAAEAAAKATVYTERPMPPYKAGDVWMQGAPKLVHATVEGNPCVVGDAIAEPLAGWVLSGAYSQDGEPTPDAPAPISVIEELTRRVCGKNLVDFNSPGYTQAVNTSVAGGSLAFVCNGAWSQAFYSMKCVPGESLTFSCEVDNPDGNSWQFVVRETSASGRVLLVIPTNQTTSRVVEATFIPLVDRLSFAFLPNASAAVSTATVNFNNCQLELGPIATAYEPPTGYTETVIDLGDEWLGSLPNGVHDEVVDDAEGARSGKRIGKAVYDGVAKKVVQTAVHSNGNRYFIATVSPKSANEAGTLPVDALVCDTFESKRGLLPGCVYISNYGSTIYFCLNDQTIETVAAANEWLAANPTTVYYQLATPYTIDLPAIDPPTPPEGTATLMALSTPAVSSAEWTYATNASSDGAIYVAHRDRESGEYDPSDWELSSAYTDDQLAQMAEEKAAQAKQSADEAATAAAEAAAVASGKSTTLIQSTAPAAEYRLASTLWIDTTGGANTPKQWSGSSWVAITDKAAIDAANAAAAAKLSADNAQETADEAIDAAQTAQTTATDAITEAGEAKTTAESKTRTFRATTWPTPPYNAGDRYINTSTGKEYIANRSRSS